MLENRKKMFHCEGKLERRRKKGRKGNGKIENRMKNGSKAFIDQESEEGKGEKKFSRYIMHRNTFPIMNFIIMYI